MFHFFQTGTHQVPRRMVIVFQVPVKILSLRCTELVSSRTVEDTRVLEKKKTIDLLPLEKTLTFGKKNWLWSVPRWIWAMAISASAVIRKRALEHRSHRDFKRYHLLSIFIEFILTSRKTRGVPSVPSPIYGKTCILVAPNPDNLRRLLGFDKAYSVHVGMMLIRTLRYTDFKLNTIFVILYQFETCSTQVAGISTYPGRL